MIDQEQAPQFGRELRWSLSRPRPLRAMREFPGEYASRLEALKWNPNDPRSNRLCSARSDPSVLWRDEFCDIRA
jgi:hypothetical protein